MNHISRPQRSGPLRAMAKTPRHQRLKRLALIAIATIVATGSIAACSSTDPNPAPTTSASAPATAQASGCEVNPSSAPLPTAENYESAPADSRISVALNGIPSGTIKPGDPPTEVDVTLCNNSPVDYPGVGVVFVLSKCSCALYPIGLPEGTADRFDPVTGHWIPLEHPVTTTGADYLGGFTDVLELPKGKSVTLKYRFALDASMKDGKGGIEATAVMPGTLVQIGKADLPFAVSRESTTPPNLTRPTVLPFADLTYPGGLAVSAAGDVYLADTGNDRVLKLTAGSDEQTVLPFTDLHTPGAIAVDTGGNVYIADYLTEATDDASPPKSRVVKLAAGSNEQSVLPFTGLGSVRGVAVDTAGNVFVTDNTRGSAKVVKLAAGSSDQTVLPFDGNTSGNAVAVDGANNVYVGDGPNNRVVKLAAGSADQTVLPLAGLDHPDGLAVDTAGDLYVIDDENRQVVKFAAGSSTPTPVPSTGLSGPSEVAVDGAGNVYVIDYNGFGQVVKLAAQ